MGRDLKVGVHFGDGPEPGYRWNVVILDAAHRDAVKFLDEDQYHHVAEQVKELAREPDPTHSQTASIDAVEDFHELRDKGGILGGINVRVFFCLDTFTRSLVVLGAIHKQNSGPTPQGDKIRMRRRKRLYFNGDLGLARLRPNALKGSGEGEGG